MAGKPGRSGGARKGAGRPRKPPPQPAPTDKDPLAFLVAVMRGEIEPTPNQLKAAIAAAQYVHAKKGEGGKKEQRGEAAQRVASESRFAPAQGPRLVVNNKR